MNILFANTQEFNPEIGGVERVSTILAQKFEEKKCNVFFLAGKESEFSAQYSPIVQQVILPDSKNFESQSNINEFTRYLSLHQIDVIVNQAGNVSEFSRLCVKASKLYGNSRLVSVVHIDPIFRLKALTDFSSTSIPGRKGKLRKILSFIRWIIPATIYYHKFYRFIYQKSDATVLLSKRFEKSFKSITRLPSFDKLTSIPNPFPYPTESRPEVGKKQKKLIYVGRIDYDHKRLDRLVDIWSGLCSDFPNWSLDIVGDGPLKPELVKYVKQNKIERINFIDFTDPIKYYKEGEILCMTSTYEGLPMVLIEAAYFGCALVAFNSFSSLSDIIEDDKNGFIISTYDLKAYETKLRLLMENKQLRREMQSMALKIPSKFEVDRIVEEWLKLFQLISIPNLDPR